MRPGYCWHCGLWLGNTLLPQATEASSNDKEEQKRQYWAAEVVGELLANAPNLAEPPYKEQIATMISKFVDRYAKGNISALARLAELNVQALWSYMRGTDVPYFDSLLRLCYALSVTPLEFLMRKALPDQRIPQFVTNDVAVVSRGKWKPVSADDVRRMRQALEGVLTEEKDPPPSLQKVATRIGYHVATVRKHCPDISKRISARYRRNWTENDTHRMKQGLENALKSDERVSLSAVAQQLGCDSAVLRKRFPDLCQAVVTCYRERFDYEQIQRELQEILASEEAPSVDELARRMGYRHHILWANFSDLCTQIAERRAAARRKHHEERIAAYCSEIHRIVFHLHNQGMYPSSGQVIQRLGKPHALRTQEGHEAWRLTLQELGYPTGHLKKYL